MLTGSNQVSLVSTDEWNYYHHINQLATPENNLGIVGSNLIKLMLLTIHLLLGWLSFMFQPLYPLFVHEATIIAHLNYTLNLYMASLCWKRPCVQLEKRGSQLLCFLSSWLYIAATLSFSLLGYVLQPSYCVLFGYIELSNRSKT